MPGLFQQFYFGYQCIFWIFCVLLYWIIWGKIHGSFVSKLQTRKKCFKYSIYLRIVSFKCLLSTLQNQIKLVHGLFGRVTCTVHFISTPEPDQISQEGNYKCTSTYKVIIEKSRGEVSNGARHN